MIDRVPIAMLLLLLSASIGDEWRNKKTQEAVVVVVAVVVMMLRCDARLYSCPLFNDTDATPAGRQRSKAKQSKAAVPNFTVKAHCC